MKKIENKLSDKDLAELKVSMDKFDSKYEQSMFYNKEGKPISSFEWTTLFRDDKNRIVEQTRLPSGFFVSTVLVGIDLGFGFGKREPLIFETMVFPDKSLNDEECLRYTNIAEARKGHKKMVEKYKKVYPDMPCGDE